MDQIKHTVLFEEKVYLSPKDMNTIGKKSIDSVLLKHLQEKLENRCSHHGFVIPKSLQILSRSMGYIENGKYTGNIVYHVQVQGQVYNPVNGTRITGKILKKNKMGLYIVYKNAIRILVPRDLHLGNEEFENLQIGDTIDVEIRKSRFQIQDQFILSIGSYLGRTGKSTIPTYKQEEAEDEETDAAEEEEAAEEEDAAEEEEAEMEAPENLKEPSLLDDIEIA